MQLQGELWTGIIPSTLIVAGSDMIPAPIMVVDMLSTAPEIDAPLVIWFSEDSTSDRSGTSNPVSFLACFICVFGEVEFAVMLFTVMLSSCRH